MSPLRRRLTLVVGAVLCAAFVVAVLLVGRRARAPAASAARVPPAAAVSGEEVRLEANAPQWRYLHIDAAREAAALEPLPVPAHVAFDEARSAAVGAPLAGRIETVAVHLGDRVLLDERLFAVRSGALADVERDIASSRTWVDARRRVVERTRELVALQTAAQKELDEARAALREAELQWKAALARRESLRVTESEGTLYWVRAPKAGTVVELVAAAGQEVGPDHDAALLRIADLDVVRVLADLQERDVRDVVEGQTVRIRTSTGAEFAGRVAHVGEVMDPERRTVQVLIGAENPDRALRPNAYVEVVFPALFDVKRVRVPGEAVVTEGTRPVVFVARDDGRLERRPVTIGRERDGEVEILAGLSPGERFVSGGALLLENALELTR